MNAAEIAAKLTKADMTVRWFGVGHNRVYAPVRRMVDLGLIVVSRHPQNGVSWKPTPLGLAVRQIIQGETND